ncbi:hypothetical protein ONZ45_g9779 [Pleurotus djamor]|nr:hypothetical protein ONZ45_g9779 [Pleurotus djamor]
MPPPSRLSSSSFFDASGDEFMPEPKLPIHHHFNHDDDELYHLPLYSPASSDDAFSVSSTPPSSPPYSPTPSFGNSQARDHRRRWSTLAKLRNSVSVKLARSSILPPRRMYPIMVFMAVMMFLSFYGTFVGLRLPMGVSRTGGMMGTTQKAGESVLSSKRPGHGRKGRPMSKINPPLHFTPSLELAAITSFLTSLHDTHTNILPSSVDPSKPIDPELVLGFDIKRNPNAQQELRQLQEEVWSVSPVVLYGRRYSPLTRAVKALLDEMWLTPKPIYIDVDVRNDAEVLEPLLKRITGETGLPMLLIGGEVFKPPIVEDGEASKKPIFDPLTNGNSNQMYDTSLLEHIKATDKSGELGTLFDVAGVTVGKRLSTS